MLSGLDLGQTSGLAEAVRIPVIASGGVGSLEHLAALRDVAGHRTPDHAGIEGVIVGRALYDGRNRSGGSTCGLGGRVMLKLPC